MPFPKPSPLHLYAGVLTLALPASVMLGMFAAQDDPRNRFTEIDVERINIVDADGTVRLVIANQARQADTRIDGEVILKGRTRPPGMVFFDENGDEMGGLVFAGTDAARSGGMFFDQYRQDQVLGFMYNQSQRGDELRSQAGLSVWDRRHDLSIVEAIRLAEEAEAIEDEAARRQAMETLERDGVFGTRRMFIGRSPDGSVGVHLHAADGSPRMRLVVDANGDARIEFLAANGEVAKTIGAGS
jgi:hypothetical protein